MQFLQMMIHSSKSQSVLKNYEELENIHIFKQSCNIAEKNTLNKSSTNFDFLLVARETKLQNAINQKHSSKQAVNNINLILIVHHKKDFEKYYIFNSI